MQKQLANKWTKQGTGGWNQWKNLSPWQPKGNTGNNEKKVPENETKTITECDIYNNCSALVNALF